MTSKEQFEAWLEREQGLYGEDIEWQPERNCYARFGIHLAWCAWQESRNAIEISRPASITTREALDAGFMGDYAAGRDGGIEDSMKEIISAGLKVKGE
ncbi:TPA: hypothetical protein ACXP7I_003254 [Klebsiella variicola subsp. variicola]